jgi:hypothetical protein
VRLARPYIRVLRHRGVSNGGTESINLLIEKTPRLAHGFRNLDNYRLRILLVADGARVPTGSDPCSILNSP